MAIKIDDNLCKFFISLDDDQDRLFDKLVEIYPQCRQKREEVLAKLRSDLESKIDGSNVKI